VTEVMHIILCELQYTGCVNCVGLLAKEKTHYVKKMPLTLTSFKTAVTIALKCSEVSLNREIQCVEFLNITRP